MDYMELKNNDGDKIYVKFRAFEPKDAAAAVNCVRDEYGDNYHKRMMYDENYIVEQCKTGKLSLFVAETKDGKVIGTLGFRRDLPKDTSCSITTGIMLKKYRGYHTFFPFTKYVAEKIRRLDAVSAICCRLILYHDITQKRMYRAGLRPCAFVPAMIMARNFQHSYDRDENMKLTLGIMIRRMKKQNAGAIYLPQDHRETAQKIYDSLRVECEIRDVGAPLAGKSEISVAHDERQKSTFADIDNSGEDLAEKMRELHAKFADDEETFNVMLNISDEKSIAAYEVLKSMGYFFAGLKPICGTHEIMVLHNAGNVRINFDTLKLIPPFAELRDYVKKCYESRCVTDNEQ